MREENAPQIETILTHNVAEIFPSKEEFSQKLHSGEKLTFYIGIDPNIPDVHLGHAVVYKKLEQFRQMGHQVICLIGNFTARIGDPTDKTAARVRLTSEQVRQNAQEYKTQVGKVLNFEGTDNPAELRFNSEWLDKMTFEELIELAAHFTVQQMMERDMFQTRLKEQKPIYLHEFFYPLMQGYDSVAMDVDVEVGGTDQTFNMLTGRDLLKAVKGKEKFVVTCKFLMGTDGEKMSKSKGNFISLRDEPFEMYRKIMTVHDDFIVHYYDMILDTPEAELNEIQTKLEAGNNPMELKKELAFKIVAWLYSETQAQTAQIEFEDVVQKNETPSEMPEVNISQLHSQNILDILVSQNLASSKSEARRLIDQKGVKINNEVVKTYDEEIATSHVSLLQVGKGKWLRIQPN